jgi:hypothetical protein
VNRKIPRSPALAFGWGMKDGRTLPSISPHKQSDRPLWRHAPAQCSIFDLGCLMSFAFAYIFSATQLYGLQENTDYPLLALKIILSRINLVQIKARA